MSIEDHNQLSKHITSADTDASSHAGLDLAKYRPMLNGLDVSDAQADELLRIMYNIMCIFVYLDVPPETWGQIVDGVTTQFDEAATDIDS